MSGVTSRPCARREGMSRGSRAGEAGGSTYRVREHEEHPQALQPLHQLIELRRALGAPRAARSLASCNELLVAFAHLLVLADKRGAALDPLIHPTRAPTDPHQRMLTPHRATRLRLAAHFLAQRAEDRLARAAATAATGLGVVVGVVGGERVAERVVLGRCDREEGLEGELGRAGGRGRGAERAWRARRARAEPVGAPRRGVGRV